MKHPFSELNDDPGRTAHGTDDVTADTGAKKMVENEEQIRLITDAMPALIAYVDKDERYRFNNKLYEEWFGHPAEYFRGKKLLDVLGEAAYRSIKPHIEKALSGQRTSFESLVPYRDGATRHVQASYIPHVGRDGEVLGYYALVNDITERKVAEQVSRDAQEKLRESERRYRSLAETLTDTATQLSRERERLGVALRTGALGVYEWRLGDSVVWWSPETYPLYGVDPATFVPTVDAFAALVHPDDREELWRKTQACIEQRVVFIHEYRIIRPDGTLRWILNRSQLSLDADGRVDRIIGVAADITERKLLEETLERLVAERTRALHRSNEDLQQFAHVASHDLKEPVRKVRMFSSRLREELKPTLSDKAALFIDKIESAADRMQAMIEGVLRYSSMDVVEHRPRPIALADLLRQVETDLEVPIQEKGATIEYGDLPVVDGADILLYQLFYNLVHNALKFSIADIPPVVTVTASTPAPTDLEALGLPAGGSYVMITLADNGIGFDPTYAEKIFETFTRLHTRDQYEGTGLGLALCRKIVERHHGKIRARGRPGVGASFEIILPSLHPESNASLP